MSDRICWRGWLRIGLALGLFLVPPSLNAQPPASKTPSVGDGLAQAAPAAPDPKSADPRTSDAKPVDSRGVAAKSGSGGAPASTSGISDPGRTDVIYLPGPDGELVPVPKGASLQDYLIWVQERARAQKAAPSPYSVTSVALEGTADDDRVSLVARVRIHLTARPADGAQEPPPADEWVRVPLSMPEAVLRDATYTGTGEAVRDRFDPETGYSWWFKGYGKREHELTLTLSIPVRKPLPARRFQLSLPPTAVSSLKLKVPFPKVTTKVIEKSSVTTRSTGAETEIELIGLGNRVDLSWSPVLELVAAEPVLESLTNVIATLVDGESVTLEATQRVQALQGNFDVLRVRLPPASELLRVEGAQYQEHQIDPASLNQVTVKLKKATTGPVELRWTIRSKLPPIGMPIVLEGFELDRARIQTGLIAVGVVGDFQITKRGSDERFVQRVNLADLPVSMRQEQVTAAYRFLNQPFRLVLNLQKLEPYLSVEPYVFLHLTAGVTELEGVYPFQVSHGSLSEIRLQWPNWKQSGWTLEPVEPPGRIDQVLTDGDANPDLIRIRLIEPAKKPFELRLRARRTVVPDQEPAAITLPMPEASSRLPLILGVSRSDNVELDLKSEDKSLLRQLPTQAALNVTPPREFSRSVHFLYRIDAPKPAFIASMVLHQPEMSTESEVRASLDGGEIAIRQRILVDVAYERLTQLRLIVPPELKPDRIRFISQAGIELQPVRIRSVESSPGEVNLPLDQPRIGRFEIEARFNLPASVRMAAAEEGGARIPLVQSADVPYASTRFAWSDVAGPEPVIDDPAWVRQSTLEGTAAWLVSGSQPSILLKLRRPSDAALRGVVVSKVLVRTFIDQDGSSLTRAQYRIPGSVSVLPVSVPAGLELTHAWFGKQSVALHRAANVGSGATDFEINLPRRNGGGDLLLTLDFQSPLAAPPGFTDQHRLLQPALPDEIWTPQTFWELVLPENQHLFSNLSLLLPEFQWKKEGIFWQRVPTRTEAELESWISAQDGPEPLAPLSQGNHYLFSQFGPPQTANIRTMNQAAIVLIGAGLALVLGLVLVKVPVSRSVLTLLLIGFGMSAAGMWFPGPMLLLVQPAGLGLLLAVAAACIDSVIKRRRRRGVVTLSSPSGFMTAPSSINRDLVVGVGSNEFTSIRPAIASTADEGVPVKSGEP